MASTWKASDPPQDAPFFFTWSAQSTVTPFEITGGRGVWVETRGGDMWLDLGAFSYNANIGHGHPRMAKAIAEQAATVSTAPPNAVFPAKLELAERLLSIAPDGFSKVFFTVGGAEANENAIKLARMVTGRRKLASRYRSYHGASLGALSLTGDHRRPPLEPGLLPDIVRILDCDCHRDPAANLFAKCPHGAPGRLADIFRLEGPESIAALFLEPIPGTNGVRVPPKGYWQEARQVTADHGTLLVADEVLTGFGRTGRWLGIEHEGVVPDLITISKGLTGGYAPLGAVLVSDKVAHQFDERVLYCGLTGYSHPISCAAALEATKIYDDEDLIAAAGRLEGPLLDGLAAMEADFPDLIRFVRGRGLLAAIEFNADEPFFAALGAELERRRVLTHIRARDNLMVISPPLCISEEELATGLDHIASAIQEITR